MVGLQNKKKLDLVEKDVLSRLEAKYMGLVFVAEVCGEAWGHGRILALGSPPPAWPEPRAGRRVNDFESIP